MKIIRYKHRCNTPDLIEQAIKEGFEGVEFDVFLEWGNGPVVWHPPSMTPPVPLMELLVPLLTKEIPFALNVKSNGLVKYLAAFMFNKDSFAFDLPGEEIAEYAEAGIPHMRRLSEYDTQWSAPRTPALGVMVDSFEGAPEKFAPTFPGIMGIIDGPLHQKPPVVRDFSWLPHCEKLYLVCKEI